MNKYKKYFFVIVLFFFNSWGGDRVGNGAGIAEANFLYAYYNIKSFINHALELPSVEFNQAELELATKIKESLKLEYKTRKPIIFLDGRKYPHIFTDHFNGKPRIAVTHLKIGSPIFINTHLINGKDGKTPTRLSFAVSIIAHELGHHHGVEDEDYLYGFGAKIGANIDQNISKRLIVDDKDIVFRFINLGKSNIPQMTLYDPVSSFDLTFVPKGKITCPNWKQRKGELLGYQIWKSSWTRYQSEDWYLHSQLVAYCDYQGEEKSFSNITFEVFPELIKVNNKLRIKKIKKTKLYRCDFRNSHCLAKQQEFLNLKSKTDKYLMEEK